jgi:DNA-binding transcriptional ArsR family regulator
MLTTSPSPFGSDTRTRTLLALQLLGESYPRELARILDVRLAGVQAALVTLERDGLIASRLMGRTRIVKLNHRFFASPELKRFLARLAEPETKLHQRIESLRRRPRRPGKPL